MKKKFDKKVLFGIVIGIIITSGIGVLAVDYLYDSSQVKYDDTNVEQSLDELYEKINNTIDVENLTVSNVISSSNGSTSATISHTFTESGVAGVGFHNGNGDYSIDLKKNGVAINNTGFWSFGLYNNMTKLIKVNAGDILSITISGPTAVQYDYYKVFMCIFNN